MAKDLTAVITLAGAISPTVDKTIKQTSSKFRGLSLKVAAVGAAMGAALAGAAVVAGKKLYDLGAEFDNMIDTIRVGTGATGEALEALQDDAKMVLASLPTTTENAAQAIADFNTRLGLTGDQLQAVSKRGIQVADMLNEDLGTVIETTSQALQGWNVPADQMADKMDYLFKVSQSTGIGYSELNQILMTNGATMRAFGYSFDTAAALIGGMTKAGVPAQETIQAMQRGLATLSSKGIDAAEGFAQYSAKIKAAKTETEAINIAAELFGTRGGAKMAIAIREGKFNIGDLTKELQANSETINTAATDTYDFAEQWTMLKNRMKVALAPAGETVFSQMGSLIPEISETIDDIMPTIKELAVSVGTVLSRALKGVMKVIKALTPALGGLFKGFAAVMNFMIEHGDLTISILSGIGAAILTALVPSLWALIPTIWGAVTATWAWTAALLANPLTWIALAIGVLVGAIVYLWLNWDKVSAWLSESWEWLKGVFSKWGESISKTIDFIKKVFSYAWESIKAKTLAVWNAIISALSAAWNWIKETASTVWNAIVGVIKMHINNVLNGFKMLWSGITAIWDGIVATFNFYVENIKILFNGIIDFVKNIFAGNWSAAWDSIVNTFGSIFGNIGNFLKAPLNWCIEKLNSFISSLNNIQIPDWVPGVGGKGINIPLIPMLAKGGFTDGVSIAGEAGTEAVVSFDPSVRSRNIAIWSRAGQMLGVDSALDPLTEIRSSMRGGNSVSLGGITINIDAKSDATPQSIAEAIRAEIEDVADMLQGVFAGRKAGTYGNY